MEEEQEEEQEGPDYTMDEFDRTNPFGAEFRPDVLTPPPSPEPTSGPSTAPLKERSQPSLEPLKEQLPPSLGPTPEPVKEPPPPYHAFDDYPGETDGKIQKRLTNVKSQITRLKNKNDPAYKMKQSKYGYEGYDLNKLQTEEKKIENIQQHRKQKQSLLTQLQEQKKSLKPVVKQPKKAISLTPLEKVIMSRRPSVAYSDDDDAEQDFPVYEQEWETSGSGIADEAEKTINQLYVSLASIKAGNNSMKLKKQVLSLVDSLVELEIIDEKEKEKNFQIIYYNNGF